jgi:hypothetical protein
MPLVISSDMVERKYHGKENLALRNMVFSEILYVPYIA